MSDNNTIFLDFWRTFQWPDPPILYFRLYHDEQGRPIQYSRHDQPGQWIEVTPEEFAVGRMDVTVRHGKIVYPSRPRVPCLAPGAEGTACHVHDVTVIVDPAAKAHTRWSVQNHAQN